MNPDNAGMGRRVIRSEAPVRILDNGGWTDTWFAQHGSVFNVAVSPCAEILIEEFPHRGSPTVTLDVRNFHDEYTFIPGGAGRGRHPMLETAIEFKGIPEGLALRITASCGVPTGASTGTSSAILVALLAALRSLRKETWTAYDIAYEAHHVEMDLLGHQCGIQDHIASAFGGINFIEITDFPAATVTQLSLGDSFLSDLERRIVLIYLGRSHDSADMHRQVISRLEHAGADCRELNDLRAAALHARDAALAMDIEALGRAMIENTEAQRRLHADLVSPDAGQIIAIGKTIGAIGWKVNGAGGPGGTVTLLCPEDPERKEELIAGIESADRAFRNIPVRLCAAGVRTRE